MPDVTETHLPGVGVRHEFVTSTGERVGVVSYRGGRRELLVYDDEDPEVSHTVMHLSTEDTRTMSELLGATKVSEELTAVQQEVEGLSIGWLPLTKGAGLDGRTIADGRIRTRTGVSIVAVIRGSEAFPAPKPEFRFEAGDVAVAVGTSEGLDEVRSILGS